MRRLLISIGAFVGLLSISFIAFHNACESGPGLSNRGAGTASRGEPNSNSATPLAQERSQQSSAKAVSSENRDVKKQTPVSKKGADVGAVADPTQKPNRRARVPEDIGGVPGGVPGGVSGAIGPPPPPPPPAENKNRESESPKIIRKAGGVLQASATKRVEPSYPPLAKAASVSGSVVVEVTVDEAGSVISARVISGHPLLRDAAVTAARGWRFSPTQVDGAPVKVIGTITFNFNL